jgi:hypothetical protein
MSLSDFFQKGFYTAKLDDESCGELLRIVRATQFIESQDYRDVGYKAPLIAEWDDVNGPIIAAHNCDKNLRSYWHHAKQFVAPLENLLGNFDSGSVLVNKFPSGHGMNWHSDTVDTTFVQMLVYLSRDRFSVEDGGYLQISTCQVNNRGLVENQAEGPSYILPNNGTVVVMNNLLPTMVHRVEPLSCNKERVTVVFRYGYMTNTLTKKRLQIMKGEIHD